MAKMANGRASPDSNSLYINSYNMCFYLASCHCWNALSRATWSLCRLPARLLWAQPNLRLSDGVINGSGKVVLAAIVQAASPTLKITKLYHTS